MINFEVTKISSKGQIVLPSQLRSQLKISNGDQFIVLTDGENVLLKPISSPKMQTFKSLIKQSREIVKQKNIKRGDVDKIIKKVRNENSN